MTITELITALEAIKAEHGDLRVLYDNAEQGYDEGNHVYVGEFVPSGYQHAGGDWEARGEWGYNKNPDKGKKPDPMVAAYLSNWHKPNPYAEPQP